MARYCNFIAGKWRDSSSKKTVPNVNPADTSEVLGEVPLSTREEAREAIRIAEEAFRRWRDVPAPERGRVVARAHRILEEEKEELARILTREEGKTLREARGEVQKSLNVLEFMTGEAMRLAGETVPSELQNTFCYTVRQPLGVVGVITPWNFPVSIPCWKIAPALAAGNAVVFKPATLTPWTAQIVVRCFEKAGLPPGVLNLVYGSGGEVGEEIVGHEAVRAVSFTGSNDVGTSLYKRGAEGLKRIQCEMGGKNPVVILEDADLALAAESTVQGAFGSTGQRCTATSRVVIEENVADRFVEMLLERTKKLRVGNGMEEGIDVGPSVDQNQMKTVLDYIEIGKREGAKLVLGGKRLAEGAYARGYFVAPTVFADVRPEMRIAQEEIFGPVLAILRVRNFEEALAVANGVKYGLTSSIFSSDPARIFRFIDRIETGITHVNSPTVGGEPQLPFGGTKQTGVGLREMGRVAIDFYSELKTVYFDYTGKKRETNLY